MASTFDDLVPVETEAQERQEMNPEPSAFLPPGVFTMATSMDTTVILGLAAAPRGTTAGTIVQRLTNLGLGGHRHGKGEKTEGEAQEPTLCEKLKDKLHIGQKKNKDGDEGPGTYHDGHNHHYKHDQTDETTTADAWQSDKMKPLTPAQLREVMLAGQWYGSQPSELFLNVFAQAMLALDKDTFNCVVSPSLMGSAGVIPMTIISVIPDIVAHYANVIMRAEHEIILATNFWEATSAARVITDAMRELSARVMKFGQRPVVMKLMYDRGSPKQTLHPHQPVDVNAYTGDKVQLPAPADIPGIKLEVQNYHVPPVGTFHAKYMVVDRKIALLSSNNIQDRVNVEMMVHLEGPIVQSFYDMALISWWEDMEPRLPLLGKHPKYKAHGDRREYQWGAELPCAVAHGDLTAAGHRSAATLLKQQAEANMPADVLKNQTNQNFTVDKTDADEAVRVDSENVSVTQRLNTGTPIHATDISSEGAVPFTPIVLNKPHDPVPIAMVNRPPRGRPGHGDTFVPQDQAWLAAFKFARQNVFIQTPTFNAKPVVAAALQAVRRGVLVEIYADLGFNDEGELLPFQGGTNEMVAQHMYAALEPQERQNLRIFWYVGKDQKQPINAVEKSRNCHVKLMIVDGQIAIQGNGNQDSQSWYHSQEINVLVDSPQICAEWRMTIDSNQNTRIHGLVNQNDGVWYDADGNVLPGTKSPPNPVARPFVGAKGAVQRVRGEGGFAT